MDKRERPFAKMPDARICIGGLAVLGAAQIPEKKDLRDCPSSAMLVFEYHKETCHGDDLYEVL